MRKTWLLPVGFVGCVALAVACGSSSSGDDDDDANGNGDAGVVSPGDAGSDTGSGSDACGSSCTTPTDAGSDAAVIRTPNQLTGLVVWIEASDVQTSALPDGGLDVTQFNDHIDAGRPFLNFDLALPAALLPTGLNGQPEVDDHAFVEFAQTSGTPIPSFGTDPFVLEAVVFPGACGSAPCPLVTFASTTTGSDCNPVNLTIGTGNVNAVFTCGTTHTAQATLSAGAHVFGLERTSATAAALRLDGAGTAITLSSENMPLAPDLSFGGGSDEMEQGIAELVVLHNPGAGDRDALEAYLKSKYGL